MDMNSELTEGWRRDQIIALEWRVRSLELTERDLGHALDTEAQRRETLENAIRSLMARIRRLEARKDLTAQQIIHILWSHLWIRGLLILMLVSGQFSIEQFVKLAPALAKLLSH